MIAVIFEVEPRAGKLDPYLDMAADLKPMLQDIDGFISVERFQSLTTEGKYVSLSYWRDEDALIAWRRHAHHTRAQHAGRHEMFADYRLRVASVMRDYGMYERDEAPDEFRVRDAPQSEKMSE
ncbi:MAG: antibiotic biosynthesis monooxygenase [Pseudomonadota bacterium]